VFYAPFIALVVFGAATLAHWDWNGTALAIVTARPLKASVIYDLPSLYAGEGVTTTVAVTGAPFGELGRASLSLDPKGITMAAQLASADTASVRLRKGWRALSIWAAESCKRICIRACLRS
jgi:hypothetical protein